LACYLIVAGPSVTLSLGSSGLLSRLYLGNMLFFLVTLSWLLFKVLPARIAGRKALRLSLLAPLLMLSLVGLTSLIASHLSPDPHVTYSFTHSSTNILVVNAAEMMLLIGLPMFLLIVPGVVHTVRHIRWALT